MRKKCCYGQKNLGSICCSLSPSPTHLSHTTNINPFENKVWEVYFYKEVCSFDHWSSSLLLTIFPLIYVYAYASAYICIMSIQHLFWCWFLRRFSPWFEAKKIYVRIFTACIQNWSGKPKTIHPLFWIILDLLISLGIPARKCGS